MQISKLKKMLMLFVILVGLCGFAMATSATETIPEKHYTKWQELTLSCTGVYYDKYLKSYMLEMVNPKDVDEIFVATYEISKVRKSASWLRAANKKMKGCKIRVVIKDDIILGWGLGK